ncbi:MAG: pyridoxamine 5'-phosphate oxidase family protein [Alphaproteobacteria bacterium]|nr:pyridoxamine 5'-phosphate oxidase family protein [Alphaproteobacteria bacterium]
MNLTQKQIDFINENEWVVFATASNTGNPRAAVVMPSRVEPDRIILSNVQMGKSEKNIRENGQAFISSYKGDTQIKVSGMAKYQDSGTLFEEIRDFEATRDADVKGIIILNIQEIEQTEG